MSPKILHLKHGFPIVCLLANNTLEIDGEDNEAIYGERYEQGIASGEDDGVNGGR